MRDTVGEAVCLQASPESNKGVEGQRESFPTVALHQTCLDHSHLPETILCLSNVTRLSRGFRFFIYVDG